MSEETCEVNFDGFETKEDYVKIRAGIAKNVTIVNPQRKDQNIPSENSEGNPITKVVPGLSFDVTMEDGVPCNKKLTITSKRLVKKLRPLIEKGDVGRDKPLSLKIMKVGEGFDVDYTIEKVV